MTACGKDRLIPDPEIVRIPGETKFVAIPSEHCVERAPTTIPDGPVTFSETNDILAVDRATIKTLNGQIAAACSLGDTLVDDE